MVHDESELLTVSEVAKQLRVDDTTVRRWIKTGILEAITLPHRGCARHTAFVARRSTLYSHPSSIGKRTVAKRLLTCYTRR